MEIRQVLKSSASMIPVLFYKGDDGQQNEEDRGEKDPRSGKNRPGK